MVAEKSPDWLPPGFTEKIKVKDGRKNKMYIDLSTGTRFYSRPAVTRYLKAVDQSNTTTEQNKLNNMDEPFLKPHISVQSISIAVAGCNPEKKRKGKHSFKTVSSESVSADGLPPGWTKEIRTSKSGNKIRKDLYYTDPNSGYIFSSKNDVLRYLKTNDIRSCASRPKKRVLDDLQLIQNEIHSSSPVNEKLSEHLETNRQLFVHGESTGGGESSSTKSPPASEAKSLKQTEGTNESNKPKVTPAGVHSLEENISCENSNKHAEMKISTEPTKEGSEDVRVMVPDLSITDSKTKKKLPASGMKKQTDKAPVSLRKSKKRKDLSLLSRTSKRLAGCEPEILSNLVTSERAVRAAARRSSSIEFKTLPSSSLETAADNPLSSNIDPSKEAATNAFLGEETLQEIEPLENVEKSLAENQAIPDEKQPSDSTRSQESQFCYEFGNSWSDPCLEFAFKTLTGEIPIEDTLAFSGCFGDQFDIPYNQANKCFIPSESDVPVIFQRENLPHSESLKQNGAVDLLPANNISYPSCSGLSSQQSNSDVRNKDYETKVKS